MKRTFWFGLGVTAAVAARRRVAGAARQVTPAGAAENVGEAMRELAEALGSFGAEVRAGMAEREAELYGSVTDRTGIPTAPRRPATGRARRALPELTARQAGRARR